MKRSRESEANYDKLVYSVEKSRYTDIILLLKDGTSQLAMNLHKIILHTYSPYFEKLLSSLKEKDKQCIELTVRNIHVAYDAIMLLYRKMTNHGNLPECERY
jgi:BTB/POZ domain